MKHPEFATQWKNNEIGNWNHLSYSSNQLCNYEPNSEILCNRILCNAVPYNTYIKWGIIWGDPSGLQIFWIACMLFAQSCPTLCDPMDAWILCPWNFPSKNTGVGCHFLLQGIIPTQRSNPSLASPELAGRFFTTAPPGKPLELHTSLTKNCLYHTSNIYNAVHVTH